MLQQKPKRWPLARLLWMVSMCAIVFALSWAFGLPWWMSMPTAAVVGYLASAMTDPGG